MSARGQNHSDACKKAGEGVGRLGQVKEVHRGEVVGMLKKDAS